MAVKTLWQEAFRDNCNIFVSKHLISTASLKCLRAEVAFQLSVNDNTKNHIICIMVTLRKSQVQLILTSKLFQTYKNAWFIFCHVFRQSDANTVP